MAFGRLLNDLFQETHRDRLPGLDSYVKWIKPQSWYHRSVLEREQLNECPHLRHTSHLPPNFTKPSKSTLRSYKAAFEQALRNRSGKQIAKWRRIYGATLRLHGRNAEADDVDPPHQPSAPPTQPRQ